VCLIAKRPRHSTDAPNQPYDCGVFFARSLKTLTGVFTNPNAAYLSSAPGSIASPLNIGIENSRRFRALPVYAALRSEGRAGFAEIFARMVLLARRIASFICESKNYILLPWGKGRDFAEVQDEIHIIVLFRAAEESVNDNLVQKINETKHMYVSGTTWMGQKAVRIAISNWKVEVDRDFEVVKDILTAAAEGRASDS
jgi:glutamate/tyrosine decarboxylase-like PLP-dependent enzyme